MLFILLAILALGIVGVAVYFVFLRKTKKICSCSDKKCTEKNECGDQCVCPSGQICTETGQCVPACVPSCPLNYCGDNGCGQPCSCPPDFTCLENRCAPCNSDCEGKKCTEKNDCGNLCPCPEGTECNQSTGSCCKPNFCSSDCPCPSATEICIDGSCCQPDCTGKQCGTSCGESCGICSNPNSYCDQATGQCICVPDCPQGVVCGPNGCGGNCGTCPSGSACQSGKCVSCTPSCLPGQCGSDGCGGNCACPNGQQCGTKDQCCQPGQCNSESGCVCSPGQVCNSGSCCTPIRPDCSNGYCGNLGCGLEPCVCPSTATCTNNKCVCTEPCGNKTCGTDACGNSCGPACPVGYSCVEGNCVCSCPNGLCPVGGCENYVNIQNSLSGSALWLSTVAGNPAAGPLMQTVKQNWYIISSGNTSSFYLATIDTVSNQPIYLTRTQGSNICTMSGAKTPGALWSWWGSTNEGLADPTLTTALQVQEPFQNFFWPRLIPTASCADSSCNWPITSN